MLGDENWLRYHRLQPLKEGDQYPRSPVEEPIAIISGRWKDGSRNSIFDVFCTTVAVFNSIRGRVRPSALIFDVSSKRNFESMLFLLRLTGSVTISTAPATSPSVIIFTFLNVSVATMIILISGSTCISLGIVFRPSISDMPISTTTTSTCSRLNRPTAIIPVVGLATTSTPAIVFKESKISLQTIYD